MHDENSLGTYDSEAEDDLACLLLLRARSLSPCVRPFRSSSSLYCKTNKMQCIDKVVCVCVHKNNAANSVPHSKSVILKLTGSISSFLGALFLLLPLMLMSSTPDRILVTANLPFSRSFNIFSRKTSPSAHRPFCFLTYKISINHKINTFFEG